LLLSACCLLLAAASSAAPSVIAAQPNLQPNPAASLTLEKLQQLFTTTAHPAMAKLVSRIFGDKLNL